MLRLALHALTLFRIAGSFDATKRRLTDRLSRALAAAALYGAAAVVGSVGLMFLIVAMFLGLATVWPLHWAAFAVGAMLLACAGVIVLLARDPPQSRRAPRRVSPPIVSEGPGWQEFIRPAETWVRRHPGLLAAAAVGIGVILGMTQGGSSDRED